MGGEDEYNLTLLRSDIKGSGKLPELLMSLLNDFIYHSLAQWEGRQLLLQECLWQDWYIYISACYGVWASIGYTIIFKSVLDKQIPGPITCFKCHIGTDLANMSGVTLHVLVRKGLCDHK